MAAAAASSSFLPSSTSCCVLAAAVWYRRHGKMVTSVSTEKEKRENLFALILWPFPSWSFHSVPMAKWSRRSAIVASVPVSIERKQQQTRFFLSFFLWIFVRFLFSVYLCGEPQHPFTAPHIPAFSLLPNLSSPSSIHFGVLVFFFPSPFVSFLFRFIFWRNIQIPATDSIFTNLFVATRFIISIMVCVCVCIVEEDICLFNIHFFSSRFQRIKKKTHL